MEGKVRRVTDRFQEEEIKHLKELFNAKLSKLSPDVLAMMSPDTTIKAKAQGLYIPSDDVTAQQRMSW